MIDMLTNEIEKALKNNLYLIALNTALTLPDICGKAEFPDKSTTKRYIEWFDKYIGQYETTNKNKMPYLSGEVVYSLRCSLLHQGNPNIEEGKGNIDDFVLNIQKENIGIYIDTSSVITHIKVEKPYAKESIKKHRVVISSLLASAKKLGLIEDNYASPEYLEPIRGFKVEVPILNEQEAKILQKELEKESDPKKQISLMIVLLMGVRRAELAGLEWKDIDFENKTMTIARSSFRDKGGKTYTKSTKTDSSIRCISMPDKLVEYLLKYREWWQERQSILKAVWKDNDRLLLSDDGRIVCPTMYVKWLHVILERAGLPKVTLHSLRHTNITLQLIAGVDMKTVSTRAGHARASTTSEFYSHFLKSSDKNASAKINDIFNREKGLYSGDNN